MVSSVRSLQFRGMVKSCLIPHLFEVAVLPGEERHSAVAGEAHQVRCPGRPARRRRHLDSGSSS